MFYTEMEAIYTEENLKYHLKHLVATYSSEKVHKALQEVFEEEYTFLKTIFSSPVQPVKKTVKVAQPAAAAAAAAVQSPQPEIVEKSEEAQAQGPTEPKLRGDSKIKIVKQETPIEVPQTTEIPPTTPLTQNQQAPKTDFNDQKDMRKWQKRCEDKKRLEHESKGVNPETLLTAENLKKWLQEEKRTYSYIAREYVGMSDTKISEAAKALGLSSTTNRHHAIKAIQRR